jgi:integrase
MRLNRETIAALRLAPGKADQIFWDDQVRGFGIRLRAGGKRTWVCQFEYTGVQRRMTLGSAELFSPDDARKWAREQLANARLGHDPVAQKEAARVAARVTLGAVLETYLKAKQDSLRRRSMVEVSRYLRKHWAPLHRTPLHLITKRDVAARVAQLAQSGPMAAGKARATLSALYVWAMGEGIVDQNPVIATNDPGAGRAARDRVLTDAELVAVWRSCGDNDFGRIVRLLILTGQRRQEVGGMRWSELDSERGALTIPGARTKNKRPHVLPLPEAAWGIMRQVHSRHCIDQLFGRGGERGFAGWQKCKRALDERAGIAPWTLHDGRRTVCHPHG